MATALVELSAIERAKLENHETTIAIGRDHVFHVARALMEIRDDRLYRETHDSFDAYCEEKWDFKRSRASQLISFYRVLGNVSGDVTAVNNSASIPDGLPQNERVARELNRLPDDEQAEAWEEAKQACVDGEPTHQDVAAVVDQRLFNHDPAETATAPYEAPSGPARQVGDNSRTHEAEEVVLPPSAFDELIECLGECLTTAGQMQEARGTNAQSTATVEAINEAIDSAKRWRKTRPKAK